MIPSRPIAPRPLSEAKTADLRNLPAAMERAYQRAREIARQTNTFLVFSKDGQTIKLKVD